MDDDTYRAVLAEVTGRTSAADCDEAQLVALVDHFRQRGFGPKVRRAGAARADHPSARKARALWISLHQLGVVHNASEHALEAFAARQLGCERMAWARQSECYRLIEALKAMAERAGWAQRGPDGEALRLEALHEGLCMAILGKLKAAGVAPKTMTLSSAIFAFGGIRPGAPWGIDSYPAIAASFGEWLRRAGQSTGEA
nr:regulatory protein GemA [Sphingobium lignivorans]